MNDINRNAQEVKHIKIENTNYKINLYYDGSVSLIELIKNALKRDAEAFIGQIDKN